MFKIMSGAILLGVLSLSNSCMGKEIKENYSIRDISLINSNDYIGTINVHGVVGYGQHGLYIYDDTCNATCEYAVALSIPSNFENTSDGGKLVEGLRQSNLDGSKLHIKITATLTYIWVSRKATYRVSRVNLVKLLEQY